MNSSVGTQVRAGRRTGIRLVRRTAGAVAVATACLVLAPGVAAAAPTNPSDSQISAAQQAKDAAAQQVGVLAAGLASAQAQVDAANAAAAIALDTFQGKQAEHEAAQATAESAAAASRQADADLAAARAAIADFARTSYMHGSTNPGMQALMTAGDPAQMLERAALLDAAGDHRADVVASVTVAQEQAAAADVAAQDALTVAATLKQQAADALAAAEQVEAGARQQAVAFATQQSAVQAQLAAAQQTLLGLEGARAAATQYAQQQAAAQRAAAAAPQRVASAGPASVVAAGPTAGAGSSSAVETAISAAKRYVGTIYAWGGGSLSGPSVGWGVDEGVVGFDCSGLTRYAYAQAGISIARNSTQQYATLPKVSRAELQRGDLIFWALDTDRPSTIHHVAIYLGDGMILEAPQSNSVIRVTSMRWPGFIGAVRPSA
ncbi:Cell wall-associated hydrolase, NlpC family [Modestobacter sp. DSM 44400]|uniref:C40 family peptidase n=1 Tax=Modestobacter sp. DSM 44400 TaxID=1550230 RepID=UPI00089AECEB|nr:NlpC/P60 family protein [Modestobacter sp. DSM 44400]SDX80606.1 Cell wall-associated hydrolase, NlpC family [Modestobacter sp. DSM 44400]